MDLIIETDLGHDPDDFFALCYLHSIGVNIRAITVAEGDPDQIAVAKFFCKEVGLDIPIGAANLERKFNGAVGGFHMKMLNKHGYPVVDKADGLGHQIIADAFAKYPDSGVFIIGPAKSFGRYIKDHEIKNKIKRVNFQGGFLAYQHNPYPYVKLDKFDGKETVPTFNLNGAKKETLAIIDSPHIENLSFVSKSCFRKKIEQMSYLLMGWPLILRIMMRKSSMTRARLCV